MRLLGNGVIAYGDLNSKHHPSPLQMYHYLVQKSPPQLGLQNQEFSASLENAMLPSYVKVDLDESKKASFI